MSNLLTGIPGLMLRNIAYNAHLLFNIHPWHLSTAFLCQRTITTIVFIVLSVQLENICTYMEVQEGFTNIGTQAFNPNKKFTVHPIQMIIYGSSAFRKFTTC